MTTTVEILGDRHDTDVVAYVVAAQDDPARHVTLVGEGTTVVRGDLEGVADWRAHTLVARGTDGRVTGVLVADTDAELGRCWWMGPWADDTATARALLAAAGPLVAATPRREFAPDARNEALRSLAADLGYVEEEASAILRRDLTTWDHTAVGPHVRDLAPDDRSEVAALHDRVFPATHTPGRRLVDDPATLVLVCGTPAHGYVATQVQTDGNLYIDFLGVAPEHRGRALGRALLIATVQRAVEAGCSEAFLTVRVGNAVARSLYAGLGFDEERIAVPLRHGFSQDVTSTA